MVILTGSATYLFGYVYPVFACGTMVMHLFVFSFVYMIEELA